MQGRLESLILKNLITNDEYTRKVLPFIKTDYFQDSSERLLYQKIEEFVTQYNTLPSFEVLRISVNKTEKVREEDVKSCLKLLDEMKSSETEKIDSSWLLDNTEKFCRDKAIYNALLESISIADGKNNKKSPSSIPELLSTALAISFDANIGHDYLGDFELRFEEYHKKELKIPCDLDYFNKITKGGVSPKTLNLIIGGTNIGKTAVMCHLAASYLSQGYKVLYITLEMDEINIARRIDTNLLNVTFDELEKLPKDLYLKKADKVKHLTNGKLFIKEYPTASASVLNFDALINELYLKKNFKADIILIDYLNICGSSRLHSSAASDSYGYVKSISEEIRGLAGKHKVPIWSATQLNRPGFKDSDPDLDQIADSFGTAFTVDLAIVLINSEELEKLNQLLAKQVKNRYDDVTKNKRFVIGIDRSRMRMYNVEKSAQKDIINSGQIKEEEDRPVFDKSKFGNKRKAYEGIKV